MLFIKLYFMVIQVFPSSMSPFTQIGDQGFLNSYYPEFANAHVFEPNLPPEVLNSRPVREMERLSTLYNADVGLYMLANKVIRYKCSLKIYEFSWMSIIVTTENSLQDSLVL